MAALAGRGVARAVGPAPFSYPPHTAKILAPLMRESLQHQTLIA